MATERIRYVDPGATGAGNGTSWTDAYTTLNACEQAEDDTGDLVSRDEWLHVYCRSSGAHNADTAAVSWGGWTTDATRYILVEAASTDRAGLSWDDSKYRLYVANSDVMTFTEDFVRIDGIQIGTSGINGNGQDIFYWINGAIGAGATFYISNCLIRGANNDTYTQAGISAGDVDTNLYMWNCVVYDIYNGTGITSVGVSWAGTNLNIYSTDIIGGRYGLYGGNAASVITAKNVYCGNQGTEGFIPASGSMAKTNCMSSDTSAEDTGASETATNCTDSQAYDADTFVNVGSGTEDFHLAADGNSPLQGAGVDTSGDAAPMNFTTNMEGEARDATWDIGADSWFVASVSNIVMNII